MSNLQLMNYSKFLTAYFSNELILARLYKKAGQGWLIILQIIFEGNYDTFP